MNPPSSVSLIATEAVPLCENCVTVKETQPLTSVEASTGLPSTPVAVIGQLAIIGSDSPFTALPSWSSNLHATIYAVPETRTLKLSVLVFPLQNPWLPVHPTLYSLVGMIQTLYSPPVFGVSA